MNFPEKLKIIEVGPRDGLQNLKTWVPTETKIKLIEDLFEAGAKAMEITSFVHPKAIPQMKDADIVAKTIISRFTDKGLRAFALVPNLVGAKKAYDCGIREISYVISASEKHNLANINRTVEQSLAELANIRAELQDIKIRLDVATAFGCPFLGKVDESLVINLIKNAMNYKLSTVTLCDTIGIANPKQMYELVKKVSMEFPDMPLAVHLHDTRGMGLANLLAAAEAGVTEFESSIGGLGGCPFAPGAAGNTATEDIINMLKEMGIATGYDLDKLLAVSKALEKELDMNFTGHMVHVSSNCSCIL